MSVRGQQDPTVVNQALKTMRSDIQCRDIKRILVASSGLAALALEHPVDLDLDIGQFGLRLRLAYSAAQRIQQVQAPFVLRGIMHLKEFPSRRQYGDEAAEN